MSLAEPGWLWLLPLVGLLALIVIVGGAMHRRRLRTVFARELMAEILPKQVRWRRIVRDVFALVGLALLVVALAEPRLDKQIRTVQTTGTDLVLLLDLSRSMDARDVDPSRLERARREIRDLGRVVAGDRVGLVVFAGGAYPRLPLTQDFSAVELVVSETDTESFESQGSDLGGAVQAALELLSRTQDQAGQAIVVLSDGEIHDAQRAREAAEQAREQGVPIFVVGIGLDPSPIPLPNGKFLEHNGQRAISTPDFEILEEVARITGGAFVISNASDRDMQDLYTEIRRNIQAVERGVHQRESWRTAYQWPLSVAALLLLLSAWLGDGRRPWGAALALIVALSGSSTAWADPLADADARYRSGRYDAAVEQLTELSLERPDDPEIFERLGAARYRASDWEGAARAFDQATRLRGEAGDALFNSGNAHYQSGRLEQALQRYDQLLQSNPEHSGAQRNRDLVVREIEERRRQQPPPPPQDGGEGDEQSQSEDSGSDSESGSSGQQGESSEGQQQGDQQQEQGAQPEAGEPGGEDQEGMSEGSGSGSPSTEGPEEEGTSEGVAPSELQEGEAEEGSEQASGGGGSASDEAAPITEGQAHRLLDAIEEGSQRMSVQGRSGDQPW